MSPWQELHRGFYLEGLLIDGADVWYTDVVLGGVHNLATGQVVLPERTMIGGLLRNADGRLLVAGLGGIEWVDPASGAAGLLHGGVSGINEMRSDGMGGIVFGTIDLPAILQGAKPGPSSICHMAQDGAVRVLAGGFTFANGLSLSADGTQLFFNESFSAVRTFAVAEGFTLGPARTLLDKPDCDGMALDAEGNVWISGFASDELVCLSPDGGTILRRLPLPGPACTNVRFGGANLEDIYVTVVDPASAQKLAQGIPLTEQSSALYRTRAPVPGAPLAPARFDLS